MIDVRIHKESLEKDERRYAYEKAIEAYWKHVDRYHTWMNYYAICVFHYSIMVTINSHDK